MCIHENKESLISHLKSELKDNDKIFKESRGMKMENILYGVFDNNVK